MAILTEEVGPRLLGRIRERRAQESNIDTILLKTFSADLLVEAGDMLWLTFRWQKAYERFLNQEESITIFVLSFGTSKQSAVR